MKKLLLIILILLPCDLWAQEGCGDWIKVKDFHWTEGNILFFSLLNVGIPQGTTIDSGFLEISVWIPKPCPTVPVIVGIGDTLRWLTPIPKKWKFSHFMFEVWDKQPCNPGGSFKLWCPPSKLDSSVVREAMCEEDYYTNDRHTVGWFPCYCLILDGIRYWMKENPLEEK